MASSSAVGVAETAVPGIDEVSEGAMYICCSELFPGHETTHSKEMFRGVVPGCNDAFKELVKFLSMATQKEDVLIVSDGRGEVTRKEIRSILTAQVGDETFIELWVIYDLETSMRQDVRNPKRNKYGSPLCKIGSPLCKIAPESERPTQTHCSRPFHEVWGVYKLQSELYRSTIPKPRRKSAFDGGGEKNNPRERGRRRIWQKSRR